MNNSSPAAPYRPPHTLHKRLPNQQDPQLEAWEHLRKAINSLINKVNTSNIQAIVLELFELDLLLGKGLFARTLIKAQFASPSFTNVYACVVAVINSKLPPVGELVLKRVIVQFRKSYRRNDKPLCLATVAFLAQLVNFRLAGHLLALEVATLLLENPTDDSVQIAVGLIKECGQTLERDCPKASECIYGRFREILMQDHLAMHTQFTIESLFAVRKAKFKDYPAMKAELDLVEDEDFITHEISLDDPQIDTQESLNFFQPRENWADLCREHQEIKQEILGDSSEEQPLDDSELGELSTQSEAKAQSTKETPPTTTTTTLIVQDQTGAALTSLRKSIYLTIMSSIDFEETVHKILKLSIPQGLHIEVCNMIGECCAQEKAFQRHYGLIAERLCKLNTVLWATCYERSFVHFYGQIHRYDTNQIRNIALLFAHLLETEAVAWSLFDCVRLTEAETTASSRIFLKVLFQDLNEHFGRQGLLNRFGKVELQEFLAGLFPKRVDNEEEAEDVRFSVNFFTAIGLGHLTEGMRSVLSALQK